MAAYFQTIPDEHFHIETSFVVKESRKMHLIIGVFFSVFALIAAGGSQYYIAGIMGLIALGSLLMSARDITIMKIDKTGFYYYGNLLTDWKNFVSARFVDEVPMMTNSSAGLSDQFYLCVRYYKNYDWQCYERKVRLTNTQDKSEEEILAAIAFYYKHYQEAE